MWKNPQFNFCSQDPSIERNFFNWDGKVIGEPIGRIHGENEDSYLKLVHKLSLLLAKLDLKVLSTNNSIISNVKKIALKMVALFWFMKHRFFQNYFLLFTILEEIFMCKLWCLPMNIFQKSTHFPEKSQKCQNWWVPDNIICANWNHEIMST